jgi:acyl dehydratase
MLNIDQPSVPLRAFARVKDAKVGDQVCWSKKFDAVHVELTGRSTGDMNPIHFDHDYAAKTRFRHPIVHGASMVGEISRVLGTEFPGRGTVWVEEKTSFRAPIYHGQTVHFCAEITETFPDKERMSIRTIGMVDERTVVENTSHIHLGPDPLVQ